MGKYDRWLASEPVPRRRQLAEPSIRTLAFVFFVFVLVPVSLAVVLMGVFAPDRLMAIEHAMGIFRARP